LSADITHHKWKISYLTSSNKWRLKMQAHWKYCMHSGYVYKVYTKRKWIYTWVSFSSCLITYMQIFQFLKKYTNLKYFMLPVFWMKDTQLVLLLLEAFNKEHIYFVHQYIYRAKLYFLANSVCSIKICEWPSSNGVNA
jgi:hypothetical protein